MYVLVDVIITSTNTYILVFLNIKPYPLVIHTTEMTHFKVRVLSWLSKQSVVKAHAYTHWRSKKASF
jgi:hypothetical protein